MLSNPDKPFAKTVFTGESVDTPTHFISFCVESQLIKVSIASI